MKSEKTGFPKYLKDGKEYFAAKITDMADLNMPSEPFGKTLRFGELNKVAHIKSLWIMEHEPEVGGYFVLADHEYQTGVYIPPEQFNEYVKENENF